MKRGTKIVRGIPTRRCAWCRYKKKPRTWADLHRATWCCSRRCSSKRLYRDRFKAVLIAGTKESNRRRTRARLEALVGQKYGELSIREIELFNLGMKTGYLRGYNRGYRLAHPRAGAAATATAA